MNCPKHPSYKAIRPPTANCPTCRQMWAEKDSVKSDREKSQLSFERKHEKKKYRELLTQVERLERELGVKNELSNYEPFVITPRKSSGTSEATAFVIASDWHYEERVRPQEVLGLNNFNLEVAKKRVARFWQGALRLWQITKKDVEIKTIVLALLGDFISGNIHEELLSTCQLEPMFAILAVQNELISGIEFLLKHTDCQLVIPCCVGNHARITKKPNSATEQGNSIETLLYHSLAQYFRGNKRVVFRIADGYLTTVTVYDKVVRFHHGHNIKWQQGVGGLAVPLLRKVGQWADMPIKADLDVVGHHHSFRDFGKAVVNGSLIGYNAYAIGKAFPFEPPKQAFFLLDKKRGKTITAPILVE